MSVIYLLYICYISVCESICAFVHVRVCTCDCLCVNVCLYDSVCLHVRLCVSLSLALKKSRYIIILCRSHQRFDGRVGEVKESSNDKCWN